MGIKIPRRLAHVWSTGRPSTPRARAHGRLRKLVIMMLACVALIGLASGRSFRWGIPQSHALYENSGVYSWHARTPDQPEAFTVVLDVDCDARESVVGTLYQLSVTSKFRPSQWAAFMNPMWSPSSLSRDSQRDARRLVSSTLQPFALNYIGRELTDSELQTFVETGSLAAQRAPRMMAMLDWVMIAGFAAILICMLLWVFPTATLTRLRLGAKKGRCAECGYELRGLQRAVCPECGAGGG